eukprot:TRINITY_DN8399_c0_g1_i1.p1 TRINITY_DN8399_c0_g1~~TRINITY_DN8399_c0_g1_i1.p1  ORF type:complete len:938 (+),score=213.54 TRINITY_DN8399_c0_g1_i1:52-2814(+)
MENTADVEMCDQTAPAEEVAVVTVAEVKHEVVMTPCHDDIQVIPQQLGMGMPIPEVAPVPVEKPALTEAEKIAAAHVAQKEAARIEVAIRIRPENSFELAQQQHRNIIEDQDNVIYIDPEQETERLGMKRRKRLEYSFDKVYSQNSSQKDVFEGTVKQLLPSLFMGYNSSVFCYGATGAGKTYTMMGDESSMPGIIPASIAEIFSMADEERVRGKDVDIVLAYSEIYNETIRDLLAEEQKPLELRVGEKGSRVAGLTWHHPASGTEVLKLIAEGNNRRVKAETNVNEASSRSHAILQLVVKTKPRGAEVNTVSHIGKISLIDLAGSERAAATENRGLRLKEGANINKSLLALGNVINALAARSPFVGYRDSKLTRMLKDSLGGNCRTIMITNISPSFLTYEDTHNALKYSFRAKMISVKLRKNTASVSAHISRYRSIIENLQTQVAGLQEQLTLANAKSKLQMVAASEKATEISTEAAELDRQLKDVSDRQIREQARLRDHEKARNESLLELRKQHQEILRWNLINAASGEQEPVRIVTLKAEIVMTQSQIAVCDCAIATAKNNLQAILRMASEIKARIPLMQPADKQHLENSLQQLNAKLEKQEMEQWIHFHKSREALWEQKFHELEEVWASTTTQIEESLKLDIDPLNEPQAIKAVRHYLTAGRKLKAKAVDVTAIEELLSGDMCEDADTFSLQSVAGSPPRRVSVGLGINHLAKPKRLTTASNTSTHRSQSSSGNTTVNKTTTRHNTTKPSTSTPSYMKATSSSIRLHKKEVAETEAEKPDMANPSVNSGHKMNRTAPPVIPSSTTPRTNVAPSFLKPTLSSQRRLQVNHQAGTENLTVPPSDDLTNSTDRATLLEERRRQRKLGQLAKAVGSPDHQLKLPVGSCTSDIRKSKRRNTIISEPDVIKRGRRSLSMDEL